MGVPAKFAPGKSNPSAALNAKAREQLVSDLKAAADGSSQILSLWAGMIVAVFVLAAGIAVYNRANTVFVGGAILGGTGCMAFLLHQLRDVHSKMVATRILLALIPNLPPEELIKVARTMQEELARAPAVGSNLRGAGARRGA